MLLMTSHLQGQRNDALARAIFDSRRTNRHIAGRAGIEETRFSKILHRRGNPTEAEKRSIARVLRRPIAELFPEQEVAA